MYLRLLPIVALVALSLTACQKELPNPNAAGTDQRQVLQSIDNQVAAAQKEGMLLSANALKQIPLDAVELPAGSTDGLAAAVAEAGPGGTVLVKAGEHYESSTVTISHQVQLIGEAGAIVMSGTEHIYTVGYVQPALHVLDAQGVLISGIDLRSVSPLGGTGILLQNAPHTIISNNSITNFGFGIVNQHGDHSYIFKNIPHAAKFCA